MKNALEKVSLAGLWLFSAVCLLSIAAQNILFVGMAGFVAWAWLGNRSALKPPREMWLWFAFMAWALAAAAFGENQAHSLETWRKWALCCAAWYAAGAIVRPRGLQAVLGSLLFFSALWCLGASLLALWRPLSGLVLGRPWAEISWDWLNKGDWRAVSGSGGYMVLGTCSMLVILFFSGLMLADKRWRRASVYACLAPVALALLLTLTRSAWLGALAGLGGLFLWKRPALAGVLAAGLVAACLLFPGSPFVQRARYSFNMQGDSNRERVFMAQAGWGIIRDHPWTGVGDSLEAWERVDGQGNKVAVEGAYQRYKPEAERLIPSLKDQDRGHLHNDVIQIAVLAGLPGLFLALAFFLRLFASALSAVKSADPLYSGLGLGLAAALAGWWINGMMEYNFGSFQSSFVLWFMAGLFFAARNLAAQGGAPE